jgi:hypothetical protein
MGAARGLAAGTAFFAVVIESGRIGDVDDHTGAGQNVVETFSASALTPVERDAATASWPRSLSVPNTFDPSTPVPPITTIFIVVSALPRHFRCRGTTRRAAIGWTDSQRRLAPLTCRPAHSITGKRR